MRLKAITVRFDLYDHEFVCLVGGTPEKVINYVVHQLGLGDWTSPEGMRGMTYIRVGKVPIMWLPGKPTTPTEIGTLAHEIVHILTAILVGKGIRLTPDSDEAFAYPMGYAVRRVLEQIK
jgi:hypothetical protein